MLMKYFNYPINLVTVSQMLISLLSNSVHIYSSTSHWTSKTISILKCMMKLYTHQCHEIRKHQLTINLNVYAKNNTVLLRSMIEHEPRLCSIAWSNQPICSNQIAAKCRRAQAKNSAKFHQDDRRLILDINWNKKQKEMRNFHWLQFESIIKDSWSYFITAKCREKLSSDSLLFIE